MSDRRRVAARLALAAVLSTLGGAALATLSVEAASATLAPAAPTPSASDIVSRNIAARGGSEAWKRTLTMAWSGHVESTGPRDLRTPFVLEQVRPDRTRFEVASQGQTAVRVFDGSSGWKLIPSATGKPDVQAYSEDELRFARHAQVIDGPLMDYVARHAAIDLVGMGDVQGKPAYVLEIKLPDGSDSRIWVDAATFLESRHDRRVRNKAGQLGLVTVYFGDYRGFEGLQLPTTIETRSSTGQVVNRLVIEKVAINPTLDMHMFAKPAVPGSRHRGVLVDTRSAGRPSPPQ